MSLTITKTSQSLPRLRYLILFLFLIIGTGYGYAGSKSLLPINNLERNTSTVHTKENFKSFAKKFFSNKEFQFERIIFPLLNTSWEPETGKIDSSFSSKDEWSFDEGQKGIAEKTRVKIIKKKNLVEYHIIGIDCGISFFYVFTLKDGKYFMTSFNGRSD